MTHEQLTAYVQSVGGVVYRSAVTRQFRNVANADEIDDALSEAVKAGTLHTFAVYTGGRPAQAIAHHKYIRKVTAGREAGDTEASGR